MTGALTKSTSTVIIYHFIIDLHGTTLSLKAVVSCLKHLWDWRFAQKWKLS